jgi:hypothetical protein
VYRDPAAVFTTGAAWCAAGRDPVDGDAITVVIALLSPGSTGGLSRYQETLLEVPI